MFGRELEGRGWVGACVMPWVHEPMGRERIAEMAMPALVRCRVVALIQESNTVAAAIRSGSLVFATSRATVPIGQGSMWPGSSSTAAAPAKESTYVVAVTPKELVCDNDDSVPCLGH